MTRNFSSHFALRRKLQCVQVAWRVTKIKYAKMMVCENPSMSGARMNARTSVSSTKWEREPAIQSSAFEEWWTAWNRHKKGTLCNVKWMKYSATSATTTARKNCRSQ